jgi:DNA-binding LytR/AlgR family response regulator
LKCTIIIDENKTEEVIIYTHKNSDLVKEIEQLVLENENLYGYRENEIISLNFKEIYSFIVEDNKVYAITQNDKLLIKSRLYKIEESLDNSFIKINQSCIINIRKIQKFNSSVLGSLQVVLKNGFKDYVSRRNIKKVKERLGI